MLGAGALALLLAADGGFALAFYFLLFLVFRLQV
jgi:hypothetical protein